LFSSIFRKRERIAVAVYGKIVVTALIVAMESVTKTAFAAILELFFSTLALVVAHVYAHMLAEEIALRRFGNWRDMRIHLGNALPVMAGINGPTLIFLLSHLGLLSIEKAFFLAKATALAMLFIYGLLLGKATGKNAAGCLIAGLVTTILGVMVLAAKVFVH